MSFLYCRNPHQTGEDAWHEAPSAHDLQHYPVEGGRDAVDLVVAEIPKGAVAEHE